jgi:nitronate monooxygenase
MASEDGCGRDNVVMAVFSLGTLAHPVVQAPMGGGPSTPALAAAVSNAGGLGFLAAGYRAPDAVRGALQELRSMLTGRAPFGVNLFAPPGHGSGAGRVGAYAATLHDEQARTGARLGIPRWDDDRYDEKIDLLCGERVPVVSFTFGRPSREEVERLHRAESAVWVTVTTPDEAEAATAVGADALVVQGMEAGGHRGGFDDARPGDLALLTLLQLVRARLGERPPLVATGGIATGAAVAAVLAAGASAAQLGTAFMLCPEAGTSVPHREALARGDTPTALTRAFTGRTARGIVNRFLLEHSADAPSAYPEVHHLTAPIRAAARQHGNTDVLHLWAGQAYGLTEPTPAADVVTRVAEQARAALVEATRRLDALA